MDDFEPIIEEAAALLTGLPAFVGPALKFALAVGLAILLHRLVYTVILRRAIGRDTLWARFLLRVRRPLRIVGVVIAVGLVASATALPPRVTDALEHMSLIAVIVVVGWFVLVAADVVSAHAMRKHRLDQADNLSARKFLTQLRILRRAVAIVMVILTAGAVLITFEGVREYGVSLFASAGAAGLVLGFAARPVLANLIAGIQIALTQPIRLEDVVIVEGEWGWIEEIYATYVVVRIWDWRRLVVPLSYFIEQPFQNWTRDSARIMGSVFWYVDYTVPLGEMRAEVERIISESRHWDGGVKVLQVVDTDKDTMHLRALMSSKDSPTNWDLRCEVREKVLDWVQRTHPQALPKLRAELQDPRDADMPQMRSA
ncbi:mechanosensitive ion channel family protein [Jannaschia formosa]|uniref:mechanosensitive ion channel family protein n=1 Tax=Jannaschia formosa TaxID=2259592 RepID=UPI000E1BEF19|nr:mechanosensitive ion channel family protein [Jannaschia formosa]TFL18526.1 mechanosensitive ion channel family protein [Jannaschia formosa]